MNRDDIEKIIEFLRKYVDEFSSIAHSLEDQLNSTTSPVVMAAEDDLVNAQVVIDTFKDESTDIDFLIGEILP